MLEQSEENIEIELNSNRHQVASSSHNSSLIEATNEQRSSLEDKENDDDDDDAEEELSDLISLPSITLTNDEYFRWIKERTTPLTTTAKTKLNGNPENSIGVSNGGGGGGGGGGNGSGLYRSDTMNTTCTFESLTTTTTATNKKNDDDETQSFFLKPLNGDEDDEIDDEIVERNLNFTRKYVDEFKKQHQRKLIQCHQQAPKTTAKSKVPQLIIQEEETEETTQTLTKPVYVKFF